MAPASTALTMDIPSGSPYQLDRLQTLKASHALLKYIKSQQAKEQAASSKTNLLADAHNNLDGVEAKADVWLVVCTKKHIIDKFRLKPGKISLPHSLNTSADTSICLITADPQTMFKDTIAHPLFPTSLSSRITRVISISKLKKEYKSYESRRQLLNEHDLFFADDRIVTLLPQALGKIFYKTGAKRPVPVSIGESKKNKEAKKSTKSERAKEDGKSVASPTEMAREIERTLSMGLVQLSPSTSTSIRVGKSGWPAQDLADNVEATVQGLVNKFITKGWRNIKAVHIKGPNTMSLPIWQADELWVDEQDVLEDAPLGVDQTERIEALEVPKASSKKRKARESETANSRKGKKTKKGDDMLTEFTLRKQKLKKQKAEAIRDREDEAVAPLKASASADA